VRAKTYLTINRIRGHRYGFIRDARTMKTVRSLGNLANLSPAQLRKVMAEYGAAMPKAGRPLTRGMAEPTEIVSRGGPGRRRSIAFPRSLVGSTHAPDTIGTAGQTDRAQGDWLVGVEDGRCLPTLYRQRHLASSSRKRF
jgi:hypothetical protein